jgi:hypothetical protein
MLGARVPLCPEKARRTRGRMHRPPAAHYSAISLVVHDHERGVSFASQFIAACLTVNAATHFREYFRLSAFSHGRRFDTGASSDVLFRWGDWLHPQCNVLLENNFGWIRFLSIVWIEAVWGMHPRWNLLLLIAGGHISGGGYGTLVRQYGLCRHVQYAR